MLLIHSLNIEANLSY